MSLIKYSLKDVHNKCPWWNNFIITTTHRGKSEVVCYRILLWGVAKFFMSDLNTPKH